MDFVIQYSLWVLQGVEAKGRVNSVALLRVLRYPADDVMYQLVHLRGNAPPEQSSLACGTMYYVRDLRWIPKIDPKGHMLDRFMACVLMREEPAACPDT